MQSLSFPIPSKCILNRDPIVTLSASNESRAVTFGKKLGKGAYGNVYALAKATPETIESSDIHFTLPDTLLGHYVIKMCTDTVPGKGTLELLNDNVINRFRQHKLIERTQTLENLKKEAAYVTRYSGKKAVTVAGDPIINIAVNTQEQLAYLNYHPAIGMLMPYVSGMPLTNYAEMFFKTGYTFSCLLTLFTQILDEFFYLHSLHILHLDPNLGNIMIDPKTQKITLIDFGQSTDLKKSIQEPCSIPRVEMNGHYQYWRPNRLRPVGSRESNVTVGIEDDAYGLRMCFTNLTGLYQAYVQTEAIAIPLIACFNQMRVLLDTPEARLKNPLWFLMKIVNVIDCFYKMPSQKTEAENRLKTEIAYMRSFLKSSPGKHFIFSPLKPMLDEFSNSNKRSASPLKSLSLFEDMSKENAVTCQPSETKRPADGLLEWDEHLFKKPKFGRKNSAFMPIICAVKI